MAESNPMANLDVLLDNTYVSTFITLFLAMYAGLAKPTLPSFISNLFQNQLFRIAILALIAYRGNRNPQLSIMAAVAFTVTLNKLAEQNQQEAFKQLEHFVQLEHFNQEDNE
jgi:hypothetical protein